MKPKKINFKIITDEESQPMRILKEMRDAHHERLHDARIALAWRYGWKEDQDGRLKLGQCKKASDLDRELHDYDFVILLNSEAWKAADFSDKNMRALIDHELCHCEIARNEDETPKVDEDDRTVYRTRRHDIEEFHEIVARHGLHTEALERFARAAMEAADKPLLAIANDG